MSYTLEVETRDRTTKIVNPKKARVKDYLIRTRVQVMDEDGRWYTVGACLSIGDARSACIRLEQAIKEKKEKVYFSYIY